MAYPLQYRTAMNADNEIETFALYLHRLPELDSKIAKLNKRAAKLGCEPIGYERIGERVLTFTDETGRKVKRVLVDIQFIGTAPRVNGHTFLARIEHTPAGNIIARAPGVTDAVAAEYRDADAYCDHCATKRYRKDTFIILTPEGALMRVGRNCLADFIRSDVAASLAVWTLMGECRAASDSDSDGSSGGFDTMTDDFLAAAFRAIELNGWVSKAAAREGKRSTAGDAGFAMRPCPTHPRAAAAWREAQPTDKDLELAKLALAWAAKLPGTSDYEHNLRVACSLTVVTPRNEGLIASAAMAYLRFTNELRKAATPVAPSVSRHFGIVGARYVRELVCTEQRDIASDYGNVSLYTLQDAEGAVFKWFASGVHYLAPCRELRIGDKKHFVFAVKKHDTYKGVAQTVITRAGAVDSATAGFKWLGPDGRVFKSKKELAAA